MARFINQGTLKLEIEHQKEMLTYLDRELERVENSTVDELRQRDELNLLGEGFESCFRLTMTANIEGKR